MMRFQTMTWVSTFLLAGISVFAGNEHEEETITIWPLGDSITYGAGHEGGYREALYVELKSEGYSVDFVGSTTENASPILEAAGETHHDGHSGYSIMDSVNLDGLERKGIYKFVEEWSSGFSAPDYVLLMIGTNDLNPDYKVETAPERLNTLLDHLFELCPESTILLSTVLEAGDNPFRHLATSDLKTSVFNYNQALREVVAKQKAAGNRVELVNMNAELTLADLADNLHPTPEGYDKMGRKWADAVVKAVESRAISTR